MVGQFDAKIYERLEMFKGRPHDHHDHQWLEMTEDRYAARDSGEPLQWWVCSICDAKRFKRKDVP